MKTKKLILAALFLAIGLVLPFFTMQIPKIGNMLLPMHIPVLLCGFICGGPYGAVVGLILPLLRSVLFGAPIMMPTAVAMSAELLIYGLFAGLLYHLVPVTRHKVLPSLLLTMVIGRVVWGITAYLLYSLMGAEFTWKLFASQAFLYAIPGIVIQIVLIPKIVHAIKN